MLSRRRLVSIVFLALAFNCLHAQASNPLAGVWRLVGFEGEFKDTGERIYDWGKNPRGYVVFTESGKFVVVIEAEGRKPPQTDLDRAELWKSMIAYAGTYRMDGEKHVNRIEVAWNPGMVGLDQLKFHEFRGNRLIVSTDWGPSAKFPGRLTRGHLIWERDS
jgi:hypothetical protein